MRVINGSETETKVIDHRPLINCTVTVNEDTSAEANISSQTDQFGWQQRPAEEKATYNEKPQNDRNK